MSHRYFNPRDEGERSQSSSRCVRCSNPLTLSCVTCLMWSRQPPPVLSSAPLPPPPPSQPAPWAGQVSPQCPPSPSGGAEEEQEEDTDNYATDSEGETCEDQPSKTSPREQKSNTRTPATLNTQNSVSLSSNGTGKDTEVPAKPPETRRRGRSSRILINSSSEELQSSSESSQTRRRGLSSRILKKSSTGELESSSESSQTTGRERSAGTLKHNSTGDLESLSESNSSLSCQKRDKYPICDGKPFKDGRIPPFKHFSEYRCSKCNKTFHYKHHIKRHLKRPDCDFTGKARKQVETESDEDWMQTDGEHAVKRGHSTLSDKETSDAETQKSQQKYRFHSVKECTVEEFMTGKVQILIISTGGPDSNKSTAFSHYTCNKCCKVFVSEQECELHQDDHLKRDSDGNTDCDPERTGPDEDSLQILREIKERLLICCPYCSRVFTNSKEHVAHVNTHNYTIDSEGNHVCKFCGESYKKLISIATHQSIRRSMRVCKHCGIRFESNCQIKDHMKTHTKGAKCETCGESLDGLSKLEVRRHLKTHKEKPVSLCPICGKAIAKPGLTSHIATHSDRRPFSCNVCHKSFKRKVALDDHVKIHKKTFQCETCGAYFSHATSLKAHIDFKHLGKYVECKECGKKLSRNMTLLKHVRLVHRKIKPFICSVCGFTCAARKELNEHVRIHTGEKPYQCQYCPSKFARRDYLKQHVRTHTGEKPYMCDDCGQRFTCRNSLGLHRRNRHRDKMFPCRECGQEFALQSSLDFHCYNEHGGKFPATIDSVQMTQNNTVEQSQSIPVMNSALMLPS